MKRRYIAILAAAVMTAGNVFPAFAGQWQWLDPNQDGITECYYLDDNGATPVNTVTPDGYTVDGNGAWTVNGVVQTRGTAGTGEEYPLAGMLEQFGLNDTGYSDPMIASANGAWLPYTGKYQYINSGSSNLAAVAAVLAGEPYRDFEGKVLDPIQYLADANSLTCDQANQMIGMIRDFLNSFDWKNADEMTKAKKAGEFVTTGRVYDQNTEGRWSSIGNVFIYNEGGCGHYADAYHLITRLMGMDCLITNTYRHQWNYIKINNSWYYYDASAVARFGSEPYNFTLADLARDENRYGIIYVPSHEVLAQFGIN